MPSKTRMGAIGAAALLAAETTLDQARNEMTMTGMPPQTVEQVMGLLNLQLAYARTGEGWDEYAATREKMVAKMGAAPDTIPGTPEHPYWQFIKRLYFYDPAPTLRQLQVPTLALFGELDNNIMPEKNKAAWEAALKAGGNRDYTLVVLPKGNHEQFEAKVGSNAEMPSLQRMVPAYFTTIQDWLAKRIRGFGPRD
jgi:pimeloyl-ACP methyl ester carboxylesterase